VVQYPIALEQVEVQELLIVMAVLVEAQLLQVFTPLMVAVDRL
jgi:hypothetical protein